jgi:single-stranded-DNA-specific exonuclease
VVSLDCGIKSMDKVAFAKSKGIDFIICDHHLPDTTIPEAVAVLDPKRADCPYPYKELSGCGVGFKLMHAFCLQNHLDTTALFSLLDLLVVSIAADIVPITGENRILAYYGLQQLNSGQPLRPGLAALKDLAGLKEEMDINSIVFGFAPRINAAGRMGDAKRSVHMLLAATKEEAFTKAGIIDETNKERRGHDTSITKEALLMIEQDEVLRTSRSTVLFKESWHKGVVGIVASRCIEKYYRPTIILTESNGKASGSARSVHGFDVHSAILACSDLLEQFGGHMYAAGLTLKVENIPAFRERFEQVVSRTITEEQLIPQIEIDAPLRLRQITPNFYKIIRQMEPFGPGNMAPVFMSECVYDTGSCRVVGDTHLKLRLEQEDSHPIDAIAFGMGDYYPKIRKGIPFDVCYCVEENVFRGVSSLQLRIRDIRFVNE